MHNVNKFKINWIVKNKQENSTKQKIAPLQFCHSKGKEMEGGVIVQLGRGNLQINNVVFVGINELVFSPS